MSETPFEYGQGVQTLLESKKGERGENQVIEKARVLLIMWLLFSAEYIILGWGSRQGVGFLAGSPQGSRHSVQHCLLSCPPLVLPALVLRQKEPQMETEAQPSSVCLWAVHGTSSDLTSSLFYLCIPIYSLNQQ